MTWFAWKSSNTRMKRSDKAAPNSSNAHLVSFLLPALLTSFFETLKCTCSCTCIKLICWLFQAMMLHYTQYMTTIVEVMRSRGDWYYNILIVLIHVLLQESQDSASSTFLSSIVIFRKIIRHIPSSLIGFCIYVRYNFCLSKNGKLIHWLLTCRKKGKRGCRFIPGVSIKKNFGEGGVCPRSFFGIHKSSIWN